MDANTVYEMVMGAITEDEASEEYAKIQDEFSTDHFSILCKCYLTVKSISAKNYINQEKKILMWN